MIGFAWFKDEHGDWSLWDLLLWPTTIANDQAAGLYRDMTKEYCVCTTEAYVTDHM